jgi:hypothetical protein
MNTMTITRKSSDDGLSDDIKRDAAKGLVVTPGYAILTREAYDVLERLLDDQFDEQLGMIALERSKDPQEGPTLEEIEEKYGLQGKI